MREGALPCPVLAVLLNSRELSFFLLFEPGGIVPGRGYSERGNCPGE